MKNIVSLSGGKDSTAMLIEMLERGEDVVDIVVFDTGWEFPQMYDHFVQLEEFIGRKITFLRPHQSFTYWLFEKPIQKRTRGEMRGEVYRIGHGWPSPTRRWCTRLKVNAINAYIKGLTYRKDVGPDIVQCIGFAADEEHRTTSNEQKLKVGKVRYPLIEFGMTEKDALEYCMKRGFTWGGLYEHFRRVSCFCCPLSSIDDLRKLRLHYPDLWQKMLEWDSKCGEYNRGFHKYAKVSDLEIRFANECR